MPGTRIMLRPYTRCEVSSNVRLVRGKDILTRLHVNAAHPCQKLQEYTTRTWVRSAVSAAIYNLPVPCTAVGASHATLTYIPPFRASTAVSIPAIPAVIIHRTTCRVFFRHRLVPGRRRMRDRQRPDTVRAVPRRGDKSADHRTGLY